MQYPQTSQYINGHKMATLAEIQVAPSTSAHQSTVIKLSQDWKNGWMFYCMKIHPNNVATTYNFPDALDTNPDNEYCTNILPDMITAFHCNNELLVGQFDFVNRPMER